MHRDSIEGRAPFRWAEDASFAVLSLHFIYTRTRRWLRNVLSVTTGHGINCRFSRVYSAKS